MKEATNIKLIDAEIEDWTRMRNVMARDFDGWVELHNTKDARCGLCPLYLHRTVKANGNRPLYYYSCRNCPIVRATRRTCHGWREEHGFPTTWAESREHARAGVVIILDTLEKVKAWLIARG